MKQICTGNETSKRLLLTNPKIFTLGFHQGTFTKGLQDKKETEIKQNDLIMKVLPKGKIKDISFTHACLYSTNLCPIF